MVRHTRLHYVQHLTMIVLVSIFSFTACKKSIHEPSAIDLSPAAANKTNSSAAHLGSEVITNWYKLHARMFLSANPATNNGLNAEAFAYMGIGLYESVRSGIKNSVSLSQSLYTMPEMPQKNNNGYDLQVSANAVLAALTRDFLPGSPMPIKQVLIHWKI